jgi:acyl carrier protein
MDDGVDGRRRRWFVRTLVFERKSKPVDHLFALQKIFRDIFDDAALIITAQTKQDDVTGWDSVAQVRIVLTVEEAFQVHFDTEEVSSIKSVGDLLTIIERHSAK